MWVIFMDISAGQGGAGWLQPALSGRRNLS